MIPKDHITAWRRHAPWIRDAQVEQDLVICRALTEMYSDPFLTKRLAFRGATAIYKLYLRPAVRYSEDIDLVQINTEPIGPTLNAIRRHLDVWLGSPKWQIKEGRIVLLYRFASEDSPAVPLRLKIEINSREHFTMRGHVRMPFHVENAWFTGTADVTTYTIDELFGTKLRALYQRRKGRDLFDLWHALQHGLLDPAPVVECFLHYLNRSETSVSRAQFEANLAEKSENRTFHDDIQPLFAPGTDYDPQTALAVVMERLVSKLPGDPWKGNEPKSRKRSSQ